MAAGGPHVIPGEQEALDSFALCADGSTSSSPSVTSVKAYIALGPVRHTTILPKREFWTLRESANERVQRFGRRARRPSRAVNAPCHTKCAARDIRCTYLLK
jgi:hypothetical protein